MDWNKIAENGIVNIGNIKRIGAAIKKAENNEEITIGFIGGSITMGSLSSTPETCYAYLVYQWWKNKFPNTRVNYINAGIGATTSQFGVARVESDLLQYKPDVVIVEFSVNDADTELFHETYEGLIRKILLSEKQPAVIILNNVQYDDGKNAERIHNDIGRAYDLPMVSIRKSLYPMVEAGEIDRKDITPDNLHPNDKGHLIVATIVQNYLEKVYQLVIKENDSKEYKVIGTPITKNRYMDSLRLHNKNSNPILSGFVTDLEKQNHITEIFKNGWKAKEIGDSIIFSVTGGMISIQYKKTIEKDAPIAIAILDDKEDEPIILDANFEETWGDCLYLQDLLISDEIKEHKLEIRIVEVKQESPVWFYLSSVIVANGQRQ